MFKSPKTLRTLIVDKNIRVFTATGEAKKTTSLCEFCAYNSKTNEFKRCEFVDCESVRQMVQIGIQQLIVKCPIYQPIIGFKGELGDISGQFNTIRPGYSWSNRLIPGDIVGLLDTGTSELIGKAKVIDVKFGSLSYIIDQYGEFNHLMIGANVENVSEALYNAIKKIYGPQIINESVKSTVISLERIHELGDREIQEG